MWQIQASINYTVGFEPTHLYYYYNINFNLINFAV
nr:MAG TPA: ATP synthase [Caudoviricetes sp.]